MKILYLTFTISICGIFYFLFFNETLFSKDKIFSYKSNFQTFVLQDIAHISAEELYVLAKKINEDALPGESDYAQILLTEAIRKNPKNINALLEFAQLTGMQNWAPLVKIQKRLSFVYQAFLIEPNNPKVRYKLAEIFFELNQKDLFNIIYSETLREFPNHQATYIEKIKILSKTDPKKAMELSKEILNNGADIGDFLDYFLLALQKSDEEKNFSQNLLECAEQYPNRWLWYHLGIYYVKEKKFSNAEYAFQKSISLGNHVAARLQLGIMQYRNQNNTEKAISNLKSVILSLKNNPYISADIIYLAHTQLACALMISKNMREIKNELNFLARYSFQNHQYFIATINEFLKNGLDFLLEAPMKIAIKNDPLFPFPYRVLSDILKKQKKETQSQELYDKYLILISGIN